MGNFKWGKRTSQGPLRCVLLVSRNKDNKGLDGFKERRRAYLTAWDDERILRELEAFTRLGVEGEMCRAYVSVNARSNKRVQKLLTVYLVEHDDVDMACIDAVIAGIGAKAECSIESKWLFDYDDDLELIDDFISDIKQYALVPNKKGVVEPIEVVKHSTPNGYAVITSRGFDTRELLGKWTDVTLKRDDLLCVGWMHNGE